MQESGTARYGDLIRVKSNQIERIFGRAIDTPALISCDIAVFVGEAPRDAVEGVDQNVAVIDSDLYFRNTGGEILVDGLLITHVSGIYPCHSSSISSSPAYTDCLLRCVGLFGLHCTHQGVFIIKE